MRAEAASVGFRLRAATQHLDAVIGMADEGGYGIDVLHQLSAVQGGLDRVRHEVLEGTWAAVSLDLHPRSTPIWLAN